MAQYRKKPVVIEATQWDKDGDHPNVVEIPAKVLDTIEARTDAVGINDCRWIGTLECGHIVSPGDWIITGVQGEMYPCNDEIFRMTYEAIVRSGAEVGLDDASMDIADRLHGYAMLHRGMTPESWAMAEARDEIIGLRGIAAAQRDLITALERVADISITALAEKATNVFDVAEIERKLKTLAAAKVGCMTPNASGNGQAGVLACPVDRRVSGDNAQESR